jgi:hypothetical protein
MANEEQIITLVNGTKLAPLEPEEKVQLEQELQTVLEKYQATYLPVIQEDKTLSHITQKASLFLLKIISKSDGETETTKTD